MQNSVAINIRKLRKLNKLSLDAFAKKLELSPSTVSYTHLRAHET